MRQGEHLKIRDVALIVEDIEIARARAVLLRAHTPQAVLDRLEVGEQFLRGLAGAHEHDRVHEKILILEIGRFAFVVA